MIKNPDFNSSVTEAIYSTQSQWEEEIKASYKRSANHGVPRSLLASPESRRLTPMELDKRIQRNSHILTVVLDQIKLMRGILEDSSFCMAISDTDGYVLYVMGDGPVLEQFKKRNCMPGYRWQEQDVGTCAIGLTLHTKKPVLLHGQHMYSISAQHITNSASPVFDHNGNFICIISLSGFANKVHLHTLGMLVQAAISIRLQLIEQERSRQLDLHVRYMNALVESDPRGIIALDKKGHIVRFNHKSRVMTGLNDKNIGQPLDLYIISKLSVRSYVQQGKGFIDREVLFSVDGQETTHVTSLDPLTQEKTIVGGLLTLMERGRAVRLATVMSGDHAVFTFTSIIGKSLILQQAIRIAKSAAQSNAPILLQGETGTGKELFAQAIHNASARAQAPFITINCGAIPKELLESELFGYEEGAFTGALKGGRPGKIELAHGGTVFLDEISDMPFDMQVKLLRTLQSGEIQRIGSGRNIKLDLRVITATNIDLREAMTFNQFRPDLYYRISTIVLTIPPLRERGEDILLLAETFLARYNAVLGKLTCSFSDESRQAIQRYNWPGNVRQLENYVERAVVLTNGPLIKSRHLGFKSENISSQSVPSFTKNTSLRAMEREHIARMMLEYPNISLLARALDISRPTLYRKLREYALFKPKKSKMY